MFNPIWDLQASWINALVDPLIDSHFALIFDLAFIIAVLVSKLYTFYIMLCTTVFTEVSFHGRVPFVYLALYR